MKTEIRTHYTCIKCKQQKMFHAFDIHFSGDWDEAYVKRSCRVCDPFSESAASTEEQKKLHQELQAQYRKLARLEEKMENLKLDISERKQQLNGAKKCRKRHEHLTNEGILQ